MQYPDKIPGEVGKMTDQEIRAIFEGASDFEARMLTAGENTLYAYFIDGLVASGFVSEYIYRPISRDLYGNI